MPIGINGQMSEYPVQTKLNDYETHLYEEERSANTIAKYIRDLRVFLSFLQNRELTKATVLEWKEALTQTHAPASVNSMLSAVNGFLEFIGAPQMRVKPLKIQRRIFASTEKELTLTEYRRLVLTAQRCKNQRLSLLLQTICSTGIRVSELKFIRKEDLKKGRSTVSSKGKTRTVFLPQELCSLLKRYCDREQIKTGVVFRTKSGMPLDRSNIWKEMKALCKAARVLPEKVFPHNLRHLFARSHYKLEKDLLRLADLLGHSNLSTTRIYTMENGTEHEKQLAKMKLVIGQLPTT